MPVLLNKAYRQAIENSDWGRLADIIIVQTRNRHLRKDVLVAIIEDVYSAGGQAERP